MTDYNIANLFDTLSEETQDELEVPDFRSHPQRLADEDRAIRIMYAELDPMEL